MSGWRRARRWLLWWPLTLVVVVALVVPLVLYAMLATEGGSTWLLRQATEAARVGGAEVRFADSRGTLLDRLELTDLAVQAAETRVEARRLMLDWRPRGLFKGLLHIEEIEVDGLRVAPPPAADPEPAAGPPVLPEVELPLAIRVDRLQLADAALVQPDGPVAIDRLTLAAELDRGGLAVRDLHLAAPGAVLDGEISLQGTTPHALQGRLSARLDQSLTGPEVGEVEARATLAGSALAPQFDLELTAPAELRLRGSLELHQPDPAFDLTAEWPSLTWPLRGEPEVTSREGRFRVHGTADDYRLTLTSPVQRPELPPVDMALRARGGLEGLRLEPLELQLQEARLQAEGELQWAPAVRWRLDLTAEHLDPGLFAADWPGDIGGRLAVEGRLGDGEDGDGLAVSARIERLGGTLRGYPVSARGALDWRAGRLLAEGIQIDSGPNRLALDGRADEVLDLRFDIDAPDMASLYPGLAGRLKGKGKLSGSPTAPGVTAQLSGEAVAYEDLRIRTLGLDVDWQVDGGGHGRFNAAGLTAGEAQLDRIEATLSGDLDAHRLTLSAADPDAQLALAAQGGLGDQAWQGRLQELSLNAPDLGEWRLAAPADLTVGAERARSGRLCLTQQAAELCLDGGWDQAGGLDLDGRLSGFDLARLDQYLPGEARIEGVLAAAFRVAGQPASPRVEFELRPGDGRIRLEEADEPFDLAFRDARINGRFADDRGSAELRLEVGPNGRAEGRLTIGPAQDGQRALGGRIEAAFPDLGLVAGFVPALDEVQGRLEAALTLGGTLDAPRPDGVVQVADARARVPAAGILLTDVALSLRGDGEGPLSVDGQVRSGDGRITLTGTLDPTAPTGPAVDLAISGENFQAVQLPEATAQVSPDLRLSGSGPYRLTGALRIPRAAIEIEELPSGTVAVSEDEIIVGGEPPAPRRLAPRNLEAAVRVELGDDVSFKGFGLRTGLNGALAVTLDGRGTLVDGKIELRGARYEAYGQDLTVEQGRLLFAGPPGNPDVDLRAVRVSRDGKVRAYLAMSGPLSKARPRVYSEPALPEAEALAYLLTGRGLDQAGRQEGADIAGAALSLGLSKGEPLLQDLGDRLGIDELRIESGGAGLADSSLVLGKYLNPDLYLGYVQGLFNPEGAVLLRLRLSDHLEVESRSGTEQSVDLFYRIEHD